MIVTVDNGIKSTQALSLAKELGMDVIVTDHHTMDEEVNCDVVVHPMLMEPCLKHYVVLESSMNVCVC